MRNSLVWKLTIVSLGIAFLTGTLVVALYQITSVPIQSVSGIKGPISLPKFNEEFLVIGLWVAVTELAMGVVLARMLVRPLEALTQAAFNISKGDLEHEVQITSKDEIGNLAAAFNRMTMNLRENQKALEKIRGTATAQPTAVMTQRTGETAEFMLERQMKEIKELEKQLREQAIRDPLTNCYNRRYLEETLEREFSRAAREKYSISLVMVDIDNFKHVNDTCGHVAGDRVLKGVSDKLQQLTRESDVVCRYGGEEFLIILPNIDLESAHRRAEEWRQAIQNLSFSVQPGFDEESQGRTTLQASIQIQVTVSIGIACFLPNRANKEQVIDFADRALYRAKKDGRNRVEVYDAETRVIQ